MTGTGTFEDRLFAVVREEVRRPRVPAVDGDDPAVDHRSAPGRRWAAGAAVAAAFAVLVGLVVSLVSTVEAPVRTGGSPTSSSTYLTFGDPMGRVHRVAAAEDQRPHWAFRPSTRRPGAPDVVLRLAHGPEDGLVAQLSEFAVMGGRSLRTMSPQDSSTPFGVAFWVEPDGSTWSITATVVEADGTAGTIDIAVVRSFVEGLTFRDGEPIAGGGFEQFVPFVDAPTRWSIADDERSLASVVDTGTDVSSLPGAATTVDGHAARFDGAALVWRRADDELLSLVVRPADPAHHDGSPTTTLARIVAIAEALRPIDRPAFEALPLRRGALVERVVIVPPAGVEVSSYSVSWLRTGEAGPGSGGTAGPVGRDGVAIDIPDGVDRVRVWSWASPDGPWAAQAPACAPLVEVPPAGAPPVIVTLDPTCRA